MCAVLLKRFVNNMVKCVEKPNLPYDNIKRIIVGKLPDSVKTELEKSGVEILEIQSSPIIRSGLSCHADLQVIHLKDNYILLNENQNDLHKKLTEYGFNVELFRLKGEKYPFDCAVNAAFVGNNVICKFDILEEKLKQFIIINGYNVINVNQGYSKCSVCVVNDNSIITEDESIKNACVMQGIDVLLIRKGYVTLEGFDYGFIGGASFKINKDTLAFIGRIDNHPDFQLIKDFLNKKNINLISLGNTELTDIGSVIPINE